MSRVSLKRQMFNYSRLFKQSFVDYYRQEYRLFWLVQLLMIIATVTSLLWIMSIILGISHHQTSGDVTGLKNLLFFWVFQWPLWQWLLLASILGVISALTSYMSIQYGVKSVMRYQKSLSQRCLSIVSDKKYQHWTSLFDQAPKLILLRILRQGVQLNGLVARRVTRAFVSVMTFILAMAVLFYVDAPLLLLLLPLALLYLVALYYINRYTARVSTEMGDVLPVTSKKFNHLVTAVLNEELPIDGSSFQQQYDQSMYMQHTRLKYLRRLSEVHVNWLNTLFLVLAIAFIIVYLVYLQSSTTINWQQLLLFLIALRYAAGSLQEIATTTVAFSRFLPEIQLLYRLINVVDCKNNEDKVVIQGNVIVYLPQPHLDPFAMRQLHHQFEFTDNSSICQLYDLRQQGLVSGLKEMAKASQQVIMIDNRLQRLQRILGNHKKHIEPLFDTVVIFSHQKSTIQQLTIDEFLHVKSSTQDHTSVDDIDDFE